MISSLRARLLLAIGALAVTAVVAVALAARQTTHVEFQRLESLERTAAAGANDERLAGAAAALDGQCCTNAAVDRAAAALAPGQALLVTDATGVAIAARGFASGVRLSDLVVTENGDELRLTAKAGPGAPLAVTEGLSLVIRGGPSRPIALADGRPATLHLFRLPADGQPATDFLTVVDRRLVAATGLVAILAVAAAWWVSRRITQPIADLSAATRDLGRGDLSRRVPEDGRDELADLARSFNTMAAELERQQALRRGLVHDVAHELRTPLTALRCRIEAAIDGLTPAVGPSLRGMNEEVAHLAQIVADLEDLARAEAGDLRLAIAEVNLIEVCQSAVRVAGLERDPRVRVDSPVPVTALADAVRMRQIVANLLTNADRHTPADGHVTVRVAARGTEAVVEVHNTGSALAPGDLERVFERFYRVDPSRQRATGGRGLGLAIVKHLTEAQHGHVWAASDTASVTVGVAVPAAPAAS